MFSNNRLNYSGYAKANEPDMAGSFFSSDAGAFDLSNISVGQTIGNASLSAAGGDLNFNANLIVVSQPSSNQIIVNAINQVTER